MMTIMGLTSFCTDENLLSVTLYYVKKEEVLKNNLFKFGHPKHGHIR